MSSVVKRLFVWIETKFNFQAADFVKLSFFAVFHLQILLILD